MKFFTLPFVLFILLVIIISCDRPVCVNHNQIFDNNKPESKIYKDELINVLTTIDKSKLTYWLKKYEEKNGKEMLFFNVQGEGLCAELALTIQNWDKLENVKEQKGISYRGAEFTNLKFTIRKDSLSTDFVYATFDKIID